MNESFNGYDQDEFFLLDTIFNDFKKMTIDVLKIWNKFSGYKTYIIGICAVVYGIYVKSPEIVITGLGLLGLRNAVATSVAKLLANQ